MFVAYFFIFCLTDSVDLPDRRISSSMCPRSGTSGIGSSGGSGNMSGILSPTASASTVGTATTSSSAASDSVRITKCAVATRSDVPDVELLYAILSGQTPAWTLEGITLDTILSFCRVVDSKENIGEPDWVLEESDKVISVFLPGEQHLVSKSLLDELAINTSVDFNTLNYEIGG